MAATVDEILDKIGSFDRYQRMLLSIFGYAMMVASTFPAMIVTFITAEPDWICVKGYNNSVCNFTEPITLTSSNYNARCSMPRDVWTYVEGLTSTVTEYDLVCDKSYLQSIAQSCSWAVTLVTLPIGGFVADRHGRKIIYYLGLVCAVLGTCRVMVFPQYFVVFIAARIFVGFAIGLQFSSAFVLLTEFTSKLHRGTIGIAYFYFRVIALPILALLAYLLPNWHHLLLATAVAATPLFFFWWITVNWVYYGVSYGSVDLGWNRYLTFALTSLIEIPSTYAAIWSIDRHGRKKTTAFGLIITCIASIVAVSIPYERTRKASTPVIFRIIMAVIAKFAINFSFSTIYVWTVELFPTVIRGIALSTSSANGRIGSLAASYVIWLIRIHPLLPFGIMGLMCFQSAILSLFLPETNGQPTTETMAEMEQKQATTIIQFRLQQEQTSPR